MDFPFGCEKIEKTVSRYKEYMNVIVTLPLLSYNELFSVESGRGVYLVYEESELIYVGKTEKIIKRLGDIEIGD